MAGFSAGVHTEAELNAQPAAASKTSRMLADAGTWSFIWVAVAFLYLALIYLGYIRIVRRG
jgi:hypothetical protein